MPTPETADSPALREVKIQVPTDRIAGSGNRCGAVWRKPESGFTVREDPYAPSGTESRGVATFEGYFSRIIDAIDPLLTTASPDHGQAGSDPGSVDTPWP